MTDYKRPQGTVTTLDKLDKQRRLEGDEGNNLRKHFQAADINSDGVLTSTEHNAYGPFNKEGLEGAKKHPLTPEQEKTRMTNRLDPNHDGLVSGKELSQSLVLKQDLAHIARNLLNHKTSLKTEDIVGLITDSDKKIAEAKGDRAKHDARDVFKASLEDLTQNHSVSIKPKEVQKIIAAPTLGTVRE